MIRVLLADDHQLVREGLKQLLGATADIRVAGEAANGDEALALVKSAEFEIAILDMSMPGLSGIDLVKRIKHEKPALRVLVLSMHGEKQYAARALKSGASGYLTKDTASEQLVAAIRKIAGGGVHISDAAAEQLLASTLPGGASPHALLSDREYEIFRLIVSGMSLTEIGDKLHLSVKTVSTHKTHIQQKLGLNSTAELVRYAMENGLA